MRDEVDGARALMVGVVALPIGVGLLLGWIPALALTLMAVGLISALALLRGGQAGRPPRRRGR